MKATKRTSYAVDILAPDPTERRTYWMSFCDGTKPKGEQFLGVAVVEVTGEEAGDPMIALRCLASPDPHDAIWIAAASVKAHAAGCNPGGEVQLMDLSKFADHPRLKDTPRCVLLSRDDLKRLGHLDDPPEELG